MLEHQDLVRMNRLSEALKKCSDHSAKQAQVIKGMAVRIEELEACLGTAIEDFSRLNSQLDSLRTWMQEYRAAEPMVTNPHTVESLLVQLEGEVDKIMNPIVVIPN